jgi:hypothetical protein
MLTHPGFAATIFVPTDAAFEALGARADDREFMKEVRRGSGVVLGEEIGRKLSRPSKFRN